MPGSLTVVIPAYNEAERLPRFMSELTDTLREATDLEVELLISDDGSGPEHVQAYEEAVARMASVFAEAGVKHRVALISSGKNQGKAAAIRYGWLAASPDTEWLAFMDADGAVCAPEFLRLVRMLDSAEFDVLAASRIRMAGRHIERSLFRHLRGRVFATVVDSLMELGFYDTQCGLKFFRAGLLRPKLPHLRERGWLLDLEILVHLQREGARMREEPVDWVDIAGSKLSGGIDPLKMLFGVLALKRRIARMERGA